MIVIIDIPEGMKESFNNENEWSALLCAEMAEVLKKGKSFSEYPTNGNIFDGLIDVDEDCVEVYGKDGTMTFTVTQEWWNAPFKRGTKDE